MQNAARVQLRTNDVILNRLPKSFDRFKILHLSDLHADMSKQALESVARIVNSINFDICVLGFKFEVQLRLTG
jgi:predicted MPP superfamily phosphohydrolase